MERTPPRRQSPPSAPTTLPWTAQLPAPGAAGERTWTRSDTKIATVTADGTITAVAPGRATVTAKVGDQTLNCAVRCIW